MRPFLFVLALVALSLVPLTEAQASGGGGPGFAPLQARRVAGQNLRFAARQGRAQFVDRGQVQQLRFAPMIVSPLVVPHFQPLGVAPVMQFRSQTIIVR